MTPLQPRAVPRLATPAYPTRLDVLADGRLLHEHVPPAWLARREMAGMLGVLLAANSAVHAADRGDPPATQEKSPPQAAIVAPLFAHGEGRGATGCVVVVAPVFLSEEDALAVIRAELAAGGVEISSSGVAWPEVSIPTRKLALRQNWVDNSRDLELVEDPANTRTLTVDLQDGKHHVFVEYLSTDDARDLDSSTMWSSVQRHDCKELADYVRKHVREQGRGAYFGAFYDPVVRMNWQLVESPDPSARDWKKRQADAAAESRRLLGLQVKDFVDWLKAQGAI